MTTEELKRLKELCEKATPGPWTYHKPWDGGLVAERSKGEFVDVPYTQADKDFIAEARTALPALIREVEELQLRLEKTIEVVIQRDEETSLLRAEVERLSQIPIKWNEDCRNIGYEDGLAEGRKENARLRAEVENLRRPLLPSEISRYHLREENTRLSSKNSDLTTDRKHWYDQFEQVCKENARLRAALEKIADPRKRDHSEPDAYTTLGCVMNIANEALGDGE